MRIHVMYGSDAYRDLVAEQLPAVLLGAGVDQTVTEFMVDEEYDEAYPRVCLSGPNNFGHAATIEVKSGDAVMMPDATVVPDGAQVMLALYDPSFFFEQYSNLEPFIAPEVANVPFEVVWSRFWEDSLPDIVMTFDTADDVEADDLERRMVEVIELRAGLFEAELSAARSTSVVDPRGSALRLRDAEHDDVFQFGGVKYCAAFRDEQDQLAVHLDYFVPVLEIHPADRLLVMWIEALGDLADEFSIKRVSVE